MSQSLTSMPVVPGAAPTRVVGPISSLVETTKPGITRLVTMTSMVGFVMSAASHSWSLGHLAQTTVLTALGTALSAAGANSINQFMERHRDARMPRTARRPLPQGRVTPGTVLGAGIGLSMAGVGVLLFLGVVPALVSLACVLSYVLMYTPLKTRTALATFVGAIPGALPPLIGWSAGAQSDGFEVLRDAGGLALFALMFIWQIPHFLAIAWMYQDDYAKGGYIVLPLIDPGGWVTASTIGLWTAALLPATLLPAWVMPGSLGVAYMTVATISGTVFAILALRLIRTRGRAEARQLFFGSIMHLPLLLVTMVGEAMVRSVL